MNSREEVARQVAAKQGVPVEDVEILGVEVTHAGDRTITRTSYRLRSKPFLSESVEEFTERVLEAGRNEALLDDLNRQIDPEQELPEKMKRDGYVFDAALLQWRDRMTGQLIAPAKLAIPTAGFCQNCQGTGKVTVGPKKDVCQICNGTGRAK